MPTRFKYRQVEPENYGLGTGEILLAEDSELNKVVGLSKLAAYNTTSVDPEKLSKKRKRLRSTMKDRLAAEAAEAAKVGKTMGGSLGHSEHGPSEQGEGLGRGQVEEDQEQVLDCSHHASTPRR